MTTIEMFEVAPQLEDVTVIGSMGGELKLPFSQLLHYKERITRPRRIREVVASPLLQSLTFLDLVSSVIFPTVTLHCLLKLHVRFQHREHLDCFTNITVPAIEEIKAVAYFGDLIQSLTVLLARCGPLCPLKTLWIRTNALEHGLLTPLLELTPFLINLDTTIPFDSRSDILSLAGLEVNPPLAPLLETCKFFCEVVVTEEVSCALNTLALARCVVSEDYAEPALRHPGEVRRLKTLCVYSDRLVLTTRQQAVLDCWPPGDNGFSGELRNLREQLHDELPELNWPRGRRSKMFRRKGDERVGNILDRINNIEVTDPTDIYVRSLLLFRKF
jgi:hypothetical protein